jgi:chromosome segregation ATPase
MRNREEKMSGLDSEIKQAEAAAAEVAAENAKRAKAATLPTLLAQKEKAERQQEARAALEDAQREATALLAEAGPAITDWRERYEAVILELDELIVGLPQLQNRVWEAMRVLARANTAVAEAHAPDNYYTAEAMQERQRNQELPPSLGGAGVGLVKRWEQAGGLNPALNALNPSEHPASLGSELGGVVHRRTRGLTIFHTSQAARLLGNFG